MCGISGALHDRTRAPVLPEGLARLDAAQRHRGPDGGGVWCDAWVGLGHRRLSIVDRDGGGQPLANESGTVRLVCNGEIYNHSELRRNLVARGHRFETGSDAEVIVHLFEEEGIDCVRRLRGMFAFALWDDAGRQLYLARDRVGEKPLVYAETRDGLLFASEIASLVTDERVAREIDPAALDQYLTHLYIPAPRTIFQSIRKLPPGHWLRCRDGERSLHRYASLSFAEQESRTEEEWRERVLAALWEAIRVRLMGEIPIGLFLSGGVDSSAVAALMSEASGRVVRSYSVGFREPAYDETSHARQVSRWLETEHHELTVGPEALERLPELVRRFGEPFGDSSALPLYYLARAAREQVTVALTGDGGDELFAGYTRYRNAGRQPRNRALEFVGGRALQALMQPAPPGRGTRAFRDRVRRRARLLGLSGEQRYAESMSYFPPPLKRRLLTRDARAMIAAARSEDRFADAFAACDGPTLLDRLMQVDTATYLPDDLLVKADIATMAHSLEARAPFLDTPLMELAARIPATLKWREGEPKYLLRRLLVDRLPPEILARPKAGFALPLDQWLRGPLRTTAEELLLSRTARDRGLFDAIWLREFVAEHMEGRADHSGPIWGLMVLELWQQQFMDARFPDAAPIAAGGRSR